MTFVDCEFAATETMGGSTIANACSALENSADNLDADSGALDDGAGNAGANLF